ncbi:MAG: type II secretion system F family protein [Candidatus Taylorbacteria bacterium]|nr:type II secretion system F family protein [Candidatus Taylorbacteria bacterium]
MLFNYKVLDTSGKENSGSMEAINLDIAIASLQRRGFIITTIHPADENKTFLKKEISLFSGVSNKDVVILSRQLSTLFNAQVSALRIFRLMAAEMDNNVLRIKLSEIADDIQGGSSISDAMAKHPKVFNDFYVNMIKAGEESGKINQSFAFLADYMDRNYELTSKARNALIYPAFIIFTFFTVMILMFTVVIPKISGLLKESGQDIPIYTKIVMTISDFLINYGFILAILVVVGAYLLWRWIKTPIGKNSFDHFKLSVPVFGPLFKKIYLSRLADNMNTMLVSGIPMVRAIELTGNVVNNAIYKDLLTKAMEDVKEGKTMSDALSSSGEIPGILIQMIKVGEETGELGQILKTLADFYSREVRNSVDTIVDLIEPAMIVLLGLGVGFLLASVLIPIYNISSSGM